MRELMRMLLAGKTTYKGSPGWVTAWSAGLEGVSSKGAERLNDEAGEGSLPRF